MHVGNHAIADTTVTAGSPHPRRLRGVCLLVDHPHAPEQAKGPWDPPQESISSSSFSSSFSSLVVHTALAVLNRGKSQTPCWIASLAWVSLLP